MVCASARPEQIAVKSGFIFYSLIGATIILSSLVGIYIRTTGMYWAAVAIQETHHNKFSKIIIALLYHQRLITLNYENFLTAMAEGQRSFFCHTPFDATLTVIPGHLDRKKNLIESFFCQTRCNEKCCRWQVFKQEGRYVFDGYTFVDS
jgi:hypothetical protein